MNKKKTIRLNENQLKHIIKESIGDYLDDLMDEGSEFLSDLATLEDELRYWRYENEANMLKKFMDKVDANPEKMRSQNPQITQMLKRVLADAEEKYNNGGSEWDDFDDFINLLKEVIDTYGHNVLAARKKYPIQNNLEFMNESKNHKNRVRVNESQMKRIVKESVKRVLKEMRGKGTIKDYLDSLPKGSIITNLKVLALMRRKGLIFYYSKPEGYLGGITPTITGEGDGRYSSITRYLFPYGNAPKDDITPEYETSEQMWEDLGPTSEIEFLGNTFSIKRLSGCANPYLQKISGNNKDEVNPTMSLYGKII